MTETVFLDELFDLDSDFYIRAHSVPAQRHAHLASRMVEMGKAEFAGKAAQAAATEGMKALEILERRGTDDVEFFC